MKQIIENTVWNLAKWLFIIYLIGVSLSTAYFNYEFAVKYGFVSWLLLGEIVATLKAVIWPLYLLHYL